MTLDLRAIDQAALEYARRLSWLDSGLRLDGEGNGSEGDGSAEGETPPVDTTEDQAPPDEGAEDIGSLPDWAQKIIKDTRAEAARHRTRAKDIEAKQSETDQVIKRLGAALGFGDSEDETASAADLQKAIEERDTTIRQLKVDGALRDVTAKHNADYELTAALLARQGRLDLDPDADDFQAELDARVKEAVEKNGRLRAGQAPPRGGGDFNNNGGSGKRPASLQDAIAGHYGTGT